MSETEVFMLLRGIFQALYPDEDSARRVVYDAGLDASRINFSSSAINYWFAILNHAKLQGLVNALLTIAEQDYPQNPTLKRAILTYQKFNDPANHGKTPFFSGHRPEKPEIFCGRQGLIKDLLFKIEANVSQGVSRRSLAIKGLPGVGKTTLALALSYHSEIERVFNGILWANLGKQVDVTNILYNWANELGVNKIDGMSSKELSNAIRRAIGERRFLLFIDNAWDLDSATLLRCGNDRCFYVITTRIDEVASEFCKNETQIIKLSDLSSADAYDLLCRLACRACDTAPELAQELVAKTGGLPLTIELLGGYLAEPRHSYFRELSKKALEELNNSTQRLQLAFRRVRSYSHITLQQAVDLSLQELPERLQELFYRLAIFAPKPGWFELSAAQTILGVRLEDLAALADYNLIEISKTEQLAIHQTLSDVAKIGFEKDANKLNRDDYLQLHREYYLKCLTHKEAQGPWFIESTLGQLRWACQTAPEPIIETLRQCFGDQQRSKRERQSIAFLLLESHQLRPTNIILAEELITYLDFIILYADIPAHRTIVVRTITPLLDTPLPNRLRAKLFVYRAGMYGELKQTDAAMKNYKEAIEILASLLDNPDHTAEDYKLFAQSNLGKGTFFNTCAEQAEGAERRSFLAQALDFHQKAVTAADQYGQDKILQARIHSELSITHALLNHWLKAKTYYQAALTLLQQGGESSENPYPRILENAGYTHWLHGQHLEGQSKKSKARKEYQQAYMLTQKEIKHLERIFDESEGLVQAHINAGDYLTAIHRCDDDTPDTTPDQAINHWQIAWQIASSLGMIGYEQEASAKLSQYLQEQTR